MKALAVGGTEDHIHMLLSLPSSLPIAKAMREIKSASSRWMHETCMVPGFEWQEGYGAFSIGWAQVEATLAYIARQEEHHRKRNFQAEFVAILKKHRLEYDLRYVWGDRRPALRDCRDARGGCPCVLLRTAQGGPPWAIFVFSVREN
jgi:hypothetical protein